MTVRSSQAAAAEESAAAAGKLTALSETLKGMVGRLTAAVDGHGSGKGRIGGASCSCSFSHSA